MAVLTVASTSPAESGAFFVTASFFDESTPPAAVVPSSITWTLTDAMKTIVNNRSQVAVSVPAASIVLVLTGDDLKLDPAYVGTTRHLLLEWVYDSTLGDDIPGKAQLAFDIVDLTALPRS